MFERFTDRARRSVLLAQAEASIIGRPLAGTEALLLGLIHEGEGVAGLVLAQLKVDLVAARDRAGDLIMNEENDASKDFTPRAKKVLDLSLREALQLGHNYIGTEHILLGLIREGSGIGVKVLISLEVDLSDVRKRVMALLAGYNSMEAAEEAEKVDSDREPGSTSAYLDNIRRRALKYGVDREAGEPVELLTDDEKRALDLTGELAGLFGQIAGTAESRHGDLAEVVSAIHILQRYVLAQAGCRAYPGEYRLLGETRA